MSDTVKLPNMEWFRGDTLTHSTPVRPVRVEWLCPQPDCTGRMEYTGTQWPMYPAGYHHRCTVCGFPGALSGEHYPRIEYRDEDA